MTKFKRDCAMCKHCRLCFLYRNVQDALHGAMILNIDGNAAPGKVADIYIALATACTEWTPSDKN